MSMEHDPGMSGLETVRHFPTAVDIQIPEADVEHAVRAAHIRGIAEEITKKMCDDFIPKDTRAELSITPQVATFIERIIFLSTRHVLEDVQSGKISLEQEK